MVTPKSKDTLQGDDVLPSPMEARKIYDTALQNDAFRTKLDVLYTTSPQLLHIEGGDIEERISFAYYYAAQYVCEQATQPHTPCFECPSCYRVAAKSHTDVLIFDGREGSIKVGDMRALKVKAAEVPRFASKRVVIILEAQHFTIESANTLLKVLEEPFSHTRFVFTIPQRERLLPTLLSRGFVLTLPWKNPANAFSDDEARWDSDLALFLRNGKELLAKTGQKGFVTQDVVLRLIVLIQKSLSHAFVERDMGMLAKIWSQLDPHGFYAVDEILCDAQEKLIYQVNPALVLENMMCALYELLPRK